MLFPRYHEQAVVSRPNPQGFLIAHDKTAPSAVRPVGSEKAGALLAGPFAISHEQAQLLTSVYVMSYE